MRFENLWINGLGCYSETLLSVDAAVAAGRYRAADAAETCMETVQVMDISAPEAAVRAGRVAVEASGELAGSHPDFLIHAYANFQGIAMWPAGCWVARGIFGEDSPVVPFEMTAWSSSTLFALLTAGRLIGPDRSARRSVLMTYADRFQEPGVDRWSLSSGMVFGDGAAAAMISNTPGAWEVQSISLKADIGLAELFRGDEQFAAVPGPVDMRERNRQYFRRGGLAPDEVRKQAAEGVRAVVAEAMADAGTTETGIDWVITPFVGRRMFEESFLEPLWDFSDRSPWQFGLTRGHLGGADQIFGLDHLRRQGQLVAGQRVLLIGTGYGFTFAAAVLRFHG
ncbi:3-oxoacyl-[acyl-carrier-protein] synthase III C-terminal domain-containing protein [Nocardia sp. NPDC004340]